GLPEPYAKRTVEGDLGVRHNIDVLVEICHTKNIMPDEQVLANFQQNPGYLPKTDRESMVDMELAVAAVEASFERHTGKIETMYGPHGEMVLQTGKDLSTVRNVVGTGGPVIHSREPLRVLSGVLARSGRSDVLKPDSATFFLDRNYILYAIGLLALTEPKKALRIMKRTLQGL
ncbi:MAG TPA: glutamate mutase L, partial [Syntrophorhabdaceae bacterium]|nr:glutamate mutase L [Syntrophorhabdaceae bacterium]